MATILIIEDNDDDIAALRRAINKSAACTTCQILVAHTAIEGLAIIEKTPPDCILLDYQLPGEIDGLEFMACLPKEDGRTLIPVVMLTAYGDEDVAVETMKSGAVDYLVKCVDGRHLKLLPTIVERAIREYTEWKAHRHAEQELLHEREFIAAVLDTAGALIVVLDRDGKVVRFNKACEKTSGYSSEEITGRYVWEFLLPEEDIAPVKSVFNSLCSGSFPNSHQNHWVSRNGEKRFIRWANTALLDAAGHVGFVVATGVDITEAIIAETQLELAANVYNNITEGILATNPDGIIVSVNPALCTMTGYTADELIGQNPRLIKSNRHDPSFYQAIWTTLDIRGSWLGEIWNQRKDGTLFLARETITAIYNDQGIIQHYAGVLRDATESKQKEELIQYQAYHDPLTDLPNRSLFLDRLHLALAHARRNPQLMAVMFLDLDHFKQINDTLGHDIGDQLLREVAPRLLACVRESDTVARMGGDEFTVIQSGLTSVEDAVTVAQKLLESLSLPFLIKEHELTISCSIGIALYPTDGDDVTTLLKKADTAMYQVKRQGRNGYALFQE
jgi:diguanylate cyclase (GGDEF)-like protein/PAS domain S-box-containing protein